jgi:hypothetical protein
VTRSCDALAASLHGPPLVHNEVRGQANAFERMRDRIAAVRALAPDLGIDGRCAVQRLDFRELRATVATDISFSATDLHNEEALRRLGQLTDDYVGSLAIRGHELDESAAEVEALTRECPDAFGSGSVSDTPARLDHILVGLPRHERCRGAGGTVAPGICSTISAHHPRAYRRQPRHLR